MIFKKIKGHAEVLSRIEKNIQGKTFEGVYLFSGPGAVGKFTIARTIGKYLTCIGLEDDSCRCENCRLFPSVPDYMEIFKGPGMITVGDIEPIEDFLSLVAYRGKSRVVVIDNAHNLNNAAANKLLKTLEEIPSDCVIILVSDTPEKLIPPMQSRCYQIPFSPLSTEDIKDILKGLGHDTDQVSEISRMIPYFSESVITNFNRYAEYVKLVPRFLKDITTIGEDDILSLIKDINYKEDTEIFIDVLLLFINDLFKLRYDSPDVVCSVKNIDYLEELTPIWKEDLCIFAMDRIRMVKEDLKKRVNLKAGQLFTPTIMWLYYFLHKK